LWRERTAAKALTARKPGRIFAVMKSLLELNAEHPVTSRGTVDFRE
jgi:hypothetical protein